MIEEYHRKVEEARLELANWCREYVGRLIENRYNALISLDGHLMREERSLFRGLEEGHRAAYALYNGRLIGIRGEVRLEDIPFEKYDPKSLITVGTNLEEAVKSLNQAK